MLPCSFWGIFPCLAVTLLDLAGFVSCMTGPSPQELFGTAAGVNVRRKFDWNGDGALDLHDFAEFQNRTVTSP